MKISIATEPQEQQPGDVIHVLHVGVFEAKPNPLFTEQQRATVRFLRYNHPVPCAECGKKRRKHWTMLVSFHAHSAGQFAIERSERIHLPFAPVCQDHLLGPAEWPRTQRKTPEGTNG